MRSAGGIRQKLTAQDAAVLPEILEAFAAASPLSRNWLRGAFESVADRELESTGTLPAAKLEAFIRDTANDPYARRLAYEWLLRVDPQASERLIPEFLYDRNKTFRREAVQRLIDAADKVAESDAEAARALYRKALSGATSEDQVKQIVKFLEEAGESVDLQEHFGFLADWRLIGPFDNTDKAGFDAVYPPEQEIDFSKSYTGKLGEVEWSKHSTSHDFGIVDLAKATKPYKGAVSYAASQFVSPVAQEVDLRLGTPNAWKLWVNGKLIFAREEYHRNMSLDQYRVTAPLKVGENTILLKVCQNEQTEDWAQRWQFQLRVCDSVGAAILSKAPQTTSAK